MASTARLDSAVPYAAYMGLPHQPPTLLDARRPEVDRALRAVEARLPGILWTAETGMGKSALLDAVTAALASTPTAAGHKGPRALRVSCHRLGADPGVKD